MAPGDRVVAGDQVGTCGTSGNSTQPHLHVPVMDSPSLLSARGLPVVFSDDVVRSRPGAGRVRHRR